MGCGGNLPELKFRLCHFLAESTEWNRRTLVTFRTVDVAESWAFISPWCIWEKVPWPSQTQQVSIPFKDMKMLFKDFFQGTCFIYLLLWNNPLKLSSFKKKTVFMLFVNLHLTRTQWGHLVLSPPHVSWGLKSESWSHLTTHWLADPEVILALHWDFSGAVGHGIIPRPLQEAWASPRPGDWVPRVRVFRERAR